MLEEQDQLQKKLKLVSKQLTLEQFKLPANDVALENVHTKLQTERSKRIELFSSLNKAIKQNINLHTQLADARKQQTTDTATDMTNIVNAKNY